MDCIVIKPEIKNISEADYWESQIATGRNVVPLNKPCKDCAVETGFYLNYAEMLLNQPKEIQDKVSDKWFCHNNCNRGCAGIREYLKLNPPKNK
jgi:hypothetical protein